MNILVQLTVKEAGTLISLLHADSETLHLQLREKGLMAKSKRELRQNRDIIIKIVLSQLVTQYHESDDPQRMALRLGLN